MTSKDWANYVGPTAVDLTADLPATSEVLLDVDASSEILELILQVAWKALPAADEVSISLIREGRVSTSNYTSEEVLELDKSQYSTEQGPCLESLSLRRVIEYSPFREPDKYVPFGADAVKSDISAVLSAPMLVKDRPEGGVNFYSKRVLQFNQHDQLLAQLFCRQAALAVAAAFSFHHSQETIEHLQLAVESRDVIGQAKGRIMASLGISADEAFDMLRRTSQEQHIRVRVLAEQIASGAYSLPRE